MKIDSPEIKTEGDFIFAAITNSLSVGGIYKFDPKHVDLNDGTFEVLLVRLPKNTTDIVDIFYNLANLNYDENQVLFFHTSNVTITTVRKIGYHLDIKDEIS